MSLIFRAISALGVHADGAMMAWTRFAHALLSLAPVAAFWTLIVRWKGLTDQRPLLLFFACNPILVYCGLQPTGLTFACVVSLTAILVFHGPGKGWPFLAGLLIGLAFACRFQDALFGIALFVAGFVTQRPRASLWLAVGALIAVAGQGAVDVVTWGEFLHSPIHYLRTNIVGGEANQGTKPLWFFAAIAAVTCMWVPPFLKSGLRAWKTGAALLPVPLGAALFYLLVHSLVPRKSLRFVFPALVILQTVIAAGLLPAIDGEPRLRLWHRRILVGFQIVLLGFLSTYYFSRGPIEAARALARQQDFQDRLLVVDGKQDTVGGFYYLRRPRLDVAVLKRGDIAGWLGAHRPAPPIYALVNEGPLAPELVPPPWRCELVGRFCDWPDLKAGTRRWVYRFTDRSGH